MLDSLPASIWLLQQCIFCYYEPIDNYLFDNFIRKYNEFDDVLITLVGNGIGNITLFPKEKSAIVQNTIGLRFNEDKKFKYYSLLSKNEEITHIWKICIIYYRINRIFQKPIFSENTWVDCKKWKRWVLQR